MKSRALFCFLIAVALLPYASRLQAAVFIVANGDVAALKSAITTSNINAQDDTIELATNGTYTLTTIDSFANGLPQIGADGGHTLTIQGNGATIQRSSVGGTPAFRIFSTHSGANFTLSGLTLTNGSLVAHGGAIYNNFDETSNATLTITNCTISGNTGDYGGAIYNDGFGSSATLIITNSTISSNRGTQYGGGVWSDGSFGSVTLTISNSTFSLNTAALDTGAVQHDAFTGIATGSITNCTFSQNSAGRNGGAIYIDGDTGSAMLTVNSCTFSQNSAAGIGGGIYVSNAGGGAAAVQLNNNIFKTGASGANLVNIGGTITSQGHNLSSDNGAGFLNAAGDQINTPPLLDPAGLQNNGGPTRTIALLSNSPALNLGDPNAPSTDQRYHSRVGVPDKGAFEFAAPVAAAGAVSRKMHTGAGTFNVNLPLTGTSGVECRDGGATGDYQFVVTFATPVTFNSAAVTSGTGTVGTASGGGTTAITVNLTAVTNVQIITVTLFGVSDGFSMANIPVQMGVLAGDVNGNRIVNGGDVLLTRNREGQITNATNFRFDVNADGVINSGDTTIVRSRSGTFVP